MLNSHQMLKGLYVHLYKAYIVKEERRDPTALSVSI